MCEMTASDFPKTWEVLRAGLEEGVAPGFVAGVWEGKNSTQVKIVAMGHRRVTPSVLPMRPDTVFDIASLTKVFATASLTALLVDRQWLEWETPLKSILPEYPDSEIKLCHLLSHTAGLPAWKPLWENLRSKFSPLSLEQLPIENRKKEMKKLLMTVSREHSVGERALYSDIGFLLLGFALEEVTQMKLQQAVRQLLWDPMGIKEAFFVGVDRGVKQGKLENVAATEDCPWRGGVLQGQVHDDNVWAMGGVGGPSGVFTTAAEVLKFSAQWLSGFFSNQTRLKAWGRVSPPDHCERTLGWDTPSGTESSAGRYFSKSSVGHLGFTGTSLWIDPEAMIAIVLLSNRVHPTRENNKIRGFRPRFHDALREDLR